MEIPSIPQSSLGAPSKCPRLQGGTPSWPREASVHRARKQPLPSQAAVWRGAGALWLGLPPPPGRSAQTCIPHCPAPPQPSRAPVFSAAVSTGAAVPRRERESGGSRPESLPLAPSLTYSLSGPLGSRLSQSPGDVSRTSLGRSRLARDLITNHGTELLCRVELRTDWERSSGTTLWGGTAELLRSPRSRKLRKERVHGQAGAFISLFPLPTFLDAS